MKGRSFVGVAVVAAGLGVLSAAPACGAVLSIIPVEALNSPQWSNFPLRTDIEDLTYDNSAMTPVGTEVQYGGHSSYGDPRVSSLDFGENWADLLIVETWSRTRSSAPAADQTPTGFSQLWWDNSTSGTSLVVEDGDVEETTVNFFLNQTNGSDTWFNDVRLTELTAVAPKARYLKVRTAASPDFGNSNVFSEIAVVGYVVPEPTGLALVSMAGLATLARRRRR